MQRHVRFVATLQENNNICGFSYFIVTKACYFLVNLKARLLSFILQVIKVKKKKSKNLVLWEMEGLKYHPVELKLVAYQVAEALNLLRKALVEVV